MCDPHNCTIWAVNGTRSIRCVSVKEMAIETGAFPFKYTEQIISILNKAG